eukprot:c9687_g1_i2.p1 GENE.c9687_g1_i2~~c9687_g1_i2.p1  ORF type:complete len:316 (-),score=66.65 c9687_g1_i2:95-1042(-)
MDVDKLLERLFRRELISEREILLLCANLKVILMEESNVVHITPPVTIVGDIHGHFDDLLEIFRIEGQPPETNFLFLGNYVNWGAHSLETVLLLLTLKFKYTYRMVLLRGNHESRLMTNTYGLYSECLSKFGSARVWQSLTDLFDFLTLSALIEQAPSPIFCVHGGLPTTITTLDQIRVLERFREVPSSGPMTDMLWSDPVESSMVTPSARGLGQLFGMPTVVGFCQTNSLARVVRGHQLVMEGYQSLFKGQLCTIWSAPNFRGVTGNIGAVLEVHDDMGTRYNLYRAAPVSQRIEALHSPCGVRDYIGPNFRPFR